MSLEEIAAELKRRCAENKSARTAKAKSQIPVRICTVCRKPGGCFDDSDGQVRCTKCERVRYADADTPAA